VSAEPLLSFVLVTDTYETIRPVVRALAAQTAAEGLEVVLVGPRATPVRPDPDDIAVFACHRVVAVESILPLAPARAAGVRAATAPLVNVGETHAFHHPGFVAATLAAFEGPWTAVVPGFHNGNPGNTLSWANFVLDYARWSFALPPAEIDFLPAYNTTFTRAFLLGLGDGLDEVFGIAHDVGVDLHAGGHRVWFEPAAGIAHVNVSRPTTWFRERFLLARSQAATRAAAWTPAWRAAYILGSPLIPVILFARFARGLGVLRRRRRLPRLTLPAAAIGLVVWTLGEVTGFTLGASSRHHLGAEEYEVHKLRYTTPRSRAVEPEPTRDARTDSRAAAR
jgi:hypothetical protein